ncbi:MAG: hypothetical protein JXA25_01635 [Anaerolineales bacterium]|nr:hypothetical protein [Anaerolineales bacterium]
MKTEQQGTRRRTAGWIAAILMTTITAFWTYWSFGEMYHEGWWGVWTNRLPYLVPGMGFLFLTVLAILYPRVGGWLLILVGIAFSVFFLDMEIINGRLVINRDWAGILISIPIAFLGGLFLMDGWQRAQGLFTVRRGAWWRRCPRLALALGVPLAIALGVSIVMLPVVLTRQDDGDRSARLIDENGVALIWAPEGPGWNYQQPWGGYPSWNSIALYGVEPVGFEDKPGYERDAPDRQFASSAEMESTNLCRYLNETGTALETRPVDIWRMPTVDELVRSLVRHGENAGCIWQGEDGERVQCTVQPDKESPLWSTDRSPVYYWAADEYDERDGYFVSFNGYVNTTYKPGGNPRHSYRCVREP